MKTSLSERAIACPNWRWMPGMLTLCGVRVSEGDGTYLAGHRPGPSTRSGGWIDTDVAGYYPDLDDPATLGCLTALIREKLNRKGPHAHFLPIRDMWYIDLDTLSFSGSTEGEVLVAALEWLS